MSDKFRVNTEPLDLSTFDRCPLCDSNLRTCETSPCPHEAEVTRLCFINKVYEEQIAESAAVYAEAEAALCMAKEAVKELPCQCEIGKEGTCALCRLEESLSSSAPCAHAEEAKRLREELRTGLAMTTCPACGSETAKTNEPRLNLENKRLREAVGTLCREALGAIIDATTIVRVEKLSGNIVKEAHAKGELFSLRLLESWLDRHVPEVMTELRRRPTRTIGGGE